MTSPAGYLLIPTEYARELRGLRWAGLGDAIETADGRTFAVVAEIASFLEGFASRRPLVHFAHVLHLLHLLRHGVTTRHDFAPLARAWREARQPARTAGAFLASLCQDVPSLTPPRVEDVCRLLRHYQEDDTFPTPPEDPPLTPEVFEAIVACSVERFTFAQLVHALRHGQPPGGDDGTRLAREVLLARPPSLGEVLAELARHERLAGAVPLVERLVGALSLPPRRLADRQLPMGGYADMGTRGQPEQILPAQFALDDLEFLRRHAEHELLYYRREEPHSPTRDELVVLLDQGVRTWGRVRLALAACALALGELARTRRLALTFATTSNGGRAIDPLRTEPAELAELLAGSDLTAHPGLALEQVVERCQGPGDVVLLTGPRNLDEPDVQAAARRLGKTTRLFAVSVTPTGEVAYSELRRGLPVPLGRFRLDLDLPVPRATVRGTDARGALATPLAEWRGEVEPVGFPFRFGPGGNHEPFLFAFDHAGEWLLTALQHGLLLLMRRDGAGCEMLPRVLVEGRLLSEVHGVVGVAGGFVVTGAVPGQVVAAHYDLGSRQVRVYSFAASTAQLAAGLEWRYLRRRHALLLRLGEQFCWVQLATGARDQPFPPELRWKPAERPTRLAVPLPPQDASAPERPGASWRRPVLHFLQHAPPGTLMVEDVVPGWRPFTPLADGQPALGNRILMRAECRGDVLAVLFLSSERRKELWLFQGPTGRTITTLPLPFERDGFALSPDGRYLALQRGPCQVEVRETAPGGVAIGQSPVGRYHNNVVVHLGEMALSLTVDRRVHLLDWIDGTLVHVHENGEPGGQVADHLRHGPPRQLSSSQALPGRVPGFLGYDRVRFRLAAWRNLIAVVTLHGEVFLFEYTGELVCGFFAFRHQLAAWMPDGTCWGAEALLGRSATSDAARRIGRALLEAWQRGEGTVT
jgi:hypothetical protein